MEEHIKEYSLGGCIVWLLCLKELPEEEVERMFSCCDKARRAKIESIGSALKKRQSIGAGYLFYLLKKRFSIAEDMVILPGGKPVFREHKEVCFNISHSGHYVVAAFGERPLGVDIECTKQANLKVAKRFFTKEEYAYVAGKGEAEQADCFYKIWTAKEAVIKAAGGGLSIPLGSFSVLEDMVRCGEENYALYRQKIESCGERVWVSVAVCDEEAHFCLRKYGV